YRRWYAVMGDTVNLAARLMSKAPAGRMYATREVLRRAKTSFEQTTLEPFSVKGKSRPVQAWDLGPPLRATTQGISKVQLPLVGRERELELLQTAIAETRRGSGALIELVGETGSGKSRLLAEARALADELRVLRCTCEVYSRETPYAAWRDLLRQLLAVGSDDADEVVRERLEAQLQSAQPDLLPWLALIAIVLDVEAAPSAEVQQLAPESRATKLHELVLATRRDEPGGMTLRAYPHARIELGPLSREDTNALALATAEATQLPPHVVEFAVQRSGGSPEFLLDLLAAAAAGNRDELPDSVGAATMARIDALDPRDGALIRRAAVLGLTFHPRRLADVVAADVPLPEDGFWDRLSGVFTRDADGHVRFLRPALQEAAYASLPFKLRRELHKAVGLRLEHDLGREPDADPAVLSQHFALAGDHARAHRYAMLAAKRATERFSHADAARLYRRAIEAGRSDGVAAESSALADAWQQLGESLQSTGEPAAAMRALTEARRLLRGDATAQARLCHRHADVAYRSEALATAVRWSMRGLRSIDGLDGADVVAWRARLRSQLAGVRNRQGRWSEAISACHQAILEAESVGELRALARARATHSTGR
ncbi:MAG: AAA family ATPase, partial [Solirubrobacteraceae bacterium]